MVSLGLKHGRELAIYFILPGMRFVAFYQFRSWSASLMALERLALLRRKCEGDLGGNRVDLGAGDSVRARFAAEGLNL